MNQFNLLSPEIRKYIFNYFWWSNLRIIDKRFKQIGDQFQIKQLNVSGAEYNYPRFWFYTNDFYNENHIIDF